jgi:hypothetical protein
MVRDIVARAEEEFDRFNVDRIDVAIGFVDSDRLLSLNRIRAARDIAQFVSNNLPPSGTWHEVRTRPLPREVSFVRVWAGTPLTRSNWWSPLAGWVSPLSQDLVQKAIDVKASKLAAYRSRTATVWLLVSSAGDGPSQYFEPDPTFDVRSIVSPFDRTFLLSQFPAKVWELGV